MQQLLSQVMQLTMQSQKGTVNKFWKDMREVKSSTAGYLISVATADVAPDWQGHLTSFHHSTQRLTLRLRYS